MVILNMTKEEAKEFGLFCKDNTSELMKNFCDTQIYKFLNFAKKEWEKGKKQEEE